MGRILVVTNSLTGGGAERSMNLLVNLLSQNGIEIALFPINQGAPDAVSPECLILGPVRVWKSGLIPTLRSFYKFRVCVKKFNPALVISNCELPELFCVFLPWRFKLIFVEHTSRPWRNHPILGFIIRALARLRSSQWVLVSGHLKNRLLYRRPYSVIPNLLTIPQPREVLSVKIDKPRLVFIGRLSPEKDPKMFLEIALLIQRVALVIGSGVLSEELKKISSAKRSNIQFAGHLSDPWSQIAPKDIVVLTSLYEGDGLVLLEAISRGLAVLVRDIPDLRRFELPEKNYFSTADEAIEKISLYGDSLVLPNDISVRILKSRSQILILQSWKKLIEHVIAP